MRSLRRTFLKERRGNLRGLAFLEELRKSGILPCCLAPGVERRLSSSPEPRSLLLQVMWFVCYLALSTLPSAGQFYV